MKKNTWKRLFTALIAALMLATALAGCGDSSSSTPEASSSQPAQTDSSSTAEPADDGKPDEWIADREIIVQAYVSDIGDTLPDDQENNPVFQEIKKRTGITLKVQYTPGESSRAVLAAQLAAGTIPDAILCYLDHSARPEFPILYKAAKDGMFADLSGYLDNAKVFSKYKEDGYLPNDTAKNIVFREDFNGAVYLLHLNIDEVDRSLIYDPEEEYIGGPYIQQAVVDELQIDPTQIRTSEDFYDLLVKIKEHGFKDDNGNDMIPLGPKYWGGSVDALDFDIKGLNWGVSDDYNIDTDGKIYHEAETDYVYDKINYVRKLLAEGLMDKEFFTIDETRAKEGCQSHSYAIIGDVHNYVDIIYQTEDWVPLGPLNDIQGDNKTVTKGKGGRGCLAISADTENPEEVFRFFDWLSTYEGQILCQYGVEGLSYTMVDGQPRVTDEIREKIDAGEDDWLINNVGAAFGGSANYLFEFVLTNKNNTDNFGESRPGATGGTAFTRSVELATKYPREYKLIEGLGATSYLNSEDMADVKAQMDLLDYNEVLVQAFFAKTDEDVKNIIESFRAQLKAAGNDKFKEKLAEIYAADPKAINFYS